MRKKLLAFLTLAIISCAVMFAMSACSGCGGHTCVYDKEIAIEKYLAKNATCTEKAEYYYSCECGEKGSETFESGEVLGHEFTNYSSDVNATCLVDGTKTAKCDRAGCNETDTLIDAGTAGHSFTNYISDNNATCLVDGTKTAKCDRAGCNEADSVPERVGHVLENDECIWCHSGSSGYLRYTLINNGAEYQVSGLNSLGETDIIIPTEYKGKPVTSIGVSDLFSGVTSIAIPSSVTSIWIASWECGLLTSIEVDSNNPNYKSIDGNLYSKDGKTLIKYAIGKTDTNFTIPDSVTSIGVEAFSGCSSLTSIVIPDSVISIGDGAFYICESLTSVVIGNSVTSIGSYAFYSCSSLTNIVIPDSVTSIDGWAFYSCSSLTSVVIPDSVKSMGSHVFVYCDPLTIYCEAESEPTGWASGWNSPDMPDIDWDPSGRPVYWYSESEPTEEGNYWHYVDGVPTKW